jgi:mannonate dehydratase
MCADAKRNAPPASIRTLSNRVANRGKFYLHPSAQGASCSVVSALTIWHCRRMHDSRTISRRRFLGLSAAALLTGCDVTVRDGLTNACQPAPLPPELRDHPLVRAAWLGLEPGRVWDVHCHVMGSGDSGGGPWMNPDMESLWNPLLYAQRRFYLNAGCVDETPGQSDLSVIARLVEQAGVMPTGFKAVLLAFDWARDPTGMPLKTQSTFHIPNEYAAHLAQRYPQHFEWIASIHPYDPRALDRLDAAAAGNARAIKWLPSAQGIDPASAQCDAFYAKLVALRMPLLTHAGDERAVTGHGEDFGNPLRLRRPLDAGVRVVVAHCASLGDGLDLDHGGTERLSNFELFARLMDEAPYRGNLFADISAITQFNRMDVIAPLLARRDWHDRLLNGSDYPLPGIVPLINLHALADRKLLDPAAVEPLNALRKHNVLLFDFVLKRALASEGAGFAPSIFETAPFFTRTAQAG